MNKQPNASDTDTEGRGCVSCLHKSLTLSENFRKYLKCEKGNNPYNTTRYVIVIRAFRGKRAEKFTNDRDEKFVSLFITEHDR